MLDKKDWSKVERTPDLVEYVYNKYGSVEVIDEMLDDLYNYAMMKNKFLSMVEAEKKAKLMVKSKKVESEKATEKIYRKLMVTKDMVEYVLEKYGKNWKVEDEIADVILEDLQIKYQKDDKGKGKVKGIWLGEIRQSMQGIMLILLLKAKKAKETKEAELKVNKEVTEVSSDEGFSGDEDVVCFNDVKYPPTNANIRMFKEIPTTSRGPTRQLASTSTRSRAPTRQLVSSFTRSRAPIASTSSKGPICVLALFAPNASNAPPPFTLQKRKSKP
ncbi:hypothetical protein Tco_0540924 [Tanacetum coccineum]